MLELRAWRNLRRRRRAHNPALCARRRSRRCTPPPLAVTGILCHILLLTFAGGHLCAGFRTRHAPSCLSPAIASDMHAPRKNFATILQVRSNFHKLLYSNTSDILVGNSLQNAAPIPYTELLARLLALLVESFQCLGSETLLSCSLASRVVRFVLVETLYV